MGLLHASRECTLRQPVLLTGLPQAANVDFNEFRKIRDSEVELVGQPISPTLGLPDACRSFSKIAQTSTSLAATRRSRSLPVSGQ